MKKLLIAILALSFCKVGIVNAHIITVSNNSVNAGQYTSLQTAVTAAHSGDTIYVSGSPTDYGSITITTPRITLIGQGDNVSGIQYNYNSILDYVYLNGVVNSVKIQGLYVNDNIQQSGPSVTVDSVDVERCYVGSNIYVYGPYWTIRNNNINNLVVQNNANCYIQNNFLEDIENSNQATVYVDHNDFVTYSGDAFYGSVVSNAIITNNVFYYSNPENNTGCTYTNNITSYGSAINLNSYAGNTGTGNIFSTPPGWVDATIPNSTVNINNVWNYNWQFTAASPAHLAATDGSDIGVYGGTYALPNKTGFASIPYITLFNTQGDVPQSTNMSITLNAQGIYAHGVVSAEYFFDADPGVGNGTSLSVTPFDSVNLSTTISVSSLTPTFHVIGIRVKDSVGHWSLYQARQFYIQSTSSLPAAPMIVAAEYFFDKDPGQGHGIPVSTGSAADSVNINFNINISTSGLSTGFHSLFIRTENAGGEWSLYEGRNFYIAPTVTIPAAPQIVAAEYFFDKDPGQGHGTSISTGAPADSVNINSSYGIGSLSVGFHSMFTRTENANGQWSLYEGRNFYVSPAASAIPAASPIVSAEYFFDKDPGQGLGTPVTVTKGDSVNINITPSIALSVGFHNLFVRTKDSLGMWSLYEGRNFYVRPGTVAYVTPRIVAAEFFYDNDPGQGNGTAITGITPGDSIHINQHVSASSLAVGSHVAAIRVKDSTGHWSLYQAQPFQVKVCSVTTTAVVDKNVSCFGGNNGSAYAVPSKGTLPYSYQWTTAPIQSNDTATGLSAGSYTVTVTDSTGCSAIDSVKITQPTKIVVKSTSVVNTTCDSANGAVIVKATGGTGTISYAWNTTPVITTAAVTDLAAGSYVVTATDANSCTSTDTIKIAPSTLPAINISVTGNACGDSIGTATASVTPGTGTPPYGYRWTNGDSINIANDLKAGVYIVTVKDKNGCINTAPAAITDTNGPAVSPIIKNVSCYRGSDGAISITVIGGKAPYTYLWSNGATTQNIAALVAAPYQVTVTDQTGCQGVFIFNVTQPFPVVVTCTSTSSACTLSTGSATANVTGGTSPYTYDWTSTGAITATNTGLSAGAYMVIVQDANGCSDTGYAAVNNTSGPTVTVSKITDADCSLGQDGIVDLTVTGGTGTDTYAWSNSTTADSLAAPSGSYNVTVTDAAGCIGTAVMNIPDTPPVAPDICLVTVDTNEKNQVIWNKTTTSHIKSFNIYRETTSAGVYTVAATVPYNSLSVWEDPIANPDVRSYTYKLTQVDSCGNESGMSAEAKTMHMTVNGYGGSVNLIWDNYIGIASIPYYIVYRDTIHNDYTAIDTVPNDGIFSFTDPSPLTTTSPVYYRMGIYDPAGCSPHTNRPTTINYNASKSNTGNITVSGVANVTGGLNSLIVYPNPTAGLINFELTLVTKQNLSLRIYNTLGQLISITDFGSVYGHMSKVIDLSGLSKGVYIMQFVGNNANMYKKVILQ